MGERATGRSNHCVDGRNHCSLLSDPDSEMVGYILDFLKLETKGVRTSAIGSRALAQYGKKGMEKMLMNPAAGPFDIVGEAKAFLDNVIGHEVGAEMEGWQQFVVHARDKRGDGVSDYMIEVLRKQGDSWIPFTKMYTDVHAYGPDQSYRCFHIRLPKGTLAGEVPLQVRIHASTGTGLMAYHGYGDTVQQLTAESAPVELDLGAMNKSLLHPFTTTLIEIILNREPLPFNSVSRVLQFAPLWKDWPTVN